MRKNVHLYRESMIKLMKNLLKFVNLSSFSILFVRGQMKKRDSGSFSSTKFNKKNMAMLTLKTTQMKNSIKVISWDAPPPSNSDHQDVSMICRGSAFTNPRVWGASHFFPPSQSHQKKIPSAPLFFNMDQGAIAKRSKPRPKAQP